MTNVFLYEDFRTFMKDEFQRRLLRNSKYSLRAFARDVGVSFSRLSETFSTDAGISMASAQKIAVRLKMSDLEKEYFYNLVIARHGRNPDTRKKAALLVRQYKAKRIFVLLRENYAGILSKWYYPALIVMLPLNRYSTPQLASILGLSSEEVTAAALHLREQGYIERLDNGRWQRSAHFLKVESPSPVRLIRGFHQAVIGKSLTALDKQSIEQRKYLSTFFSVRKENIPEARRELEEFNEAFLKKYTSQEADAVYGFSVQLFQLE